MPNMLRTLAKMLLPLIVLLVAGCDSLPSAFPSSPEPVEHDYDVRYEIDSTCGASATFSTPDGTSQRDVAAAWHPDSWWYERTASRNDFLYVSAQVDCWDGEVVVRILTWERYPFGEDDEPGWRIRKQVRSYGDFVIASASMSY